MYRLYEQPRSIQINGKIKQEFSNQFSKKKKKRKEKMKRKKNENSPAVKGQSDR